MLEDSLEDVENLLTDLKDDAVGANYLKVANSVSFSEFCTYTVDLPTSEHWRPEVKSMKQNTFKNLKDNKTFEEFRDKGLDIIGSRWIII